MINWLKEWVTLIICNVMFITLVEMILPSNSLKKYCKFVLGLILISVLINPVIKAVTNKDLVTEIAQKDYLINDNAISFDASKVEVNDKDKIVEVFNEKLSDGCEKLLSEKFQDIGFKVTIKSTMDSSNKIQISSVGVSYYDKKSIKTIEKIEINKNESESTTTEDQLLKEKIITALSDELKITRNKISAKESKEVNDETN
ncbi:MAG: stage III sporulation protein AF [Clostridiaceae bacterium]